MGTQEGVTRKNCRLCRQGAFITPVSREGACGCHQIPRSLRRSISPVEGRGVMAEPDETFEEPQGEEEVAVQPARCLHITIVDHNAVLEGTGQQSLINLKIPLELAEEGIQVVPEAKWGIIDPHLLVRMAEQGMTGELANVREKGKYIRVVVE